MEGCMSNLAKYLFFFTNFLIFILGITVFGLRKPTFLNLFEEAQSVSGIDSEFNVEIYTSAAYILLVVSFLVVLISLAAVEPSRRSNVCWVPTSPLFWLCSSCWWLDLSLATLETWRRPINDPLKQALLKYQDDATQESAPQLFAYKEAWQS